MDTPRATQLVRQATADFWQEKTAEINDVASLEKFVNDYLALLGCEYDFAVAKALTQLRTNSLAAPLAEKVAKITLLANEICAKPPAEKRRTLWQNIATITNYAEPILASLAIKLQSRKDVVNYLQSTMEHSVLWPKNDVAYKIVNVAAHYNIDENDQPLYKVWDLATELEIMPPGETVFDEKWQSLASLVTSLKRC